MVNWQDRVQPRQHYDPAQALAEGRSWVSCHPDNIRMDVIPLIRSPANETPGDKLNRTEEEVAQRAATYKAATERLQRYQESVGSGMAPSLAAYVENLRRDDPDQPSYPLGLYPFLGEPGIYNRFCETLIDEFSHHTFQRYNPRLAIYSAQTKIRGDNGRVDEVMLPLHSCYLLDYPFFVAQGLPPVQATFATNVLSLTRKILEAKTIKAETQQGVTEMSLLGMFNLGVDALLIPMPHRDINSGTRKILTGQVPDPLLRGKLLCAASMDESCQVTWEDAQDPGEAAAHLQQGYRVQDRYIVTPQRTETAIRYCPAATDPTRSQWMEQFHHIHHIEDVAYKMAYAHNKAYYAWIADSQDRVDDLLSTREPTWHQALFLANQPAQAPAMTR